MQLHFLLGVIRLKGYHVEHPVNSVVCADDANVADNAGWEVKILPRPAVVARVVHHPHPVLLVHGHLDVVRVPPARITDSEH